MVNFIFKGSVGKLIFGAGRYFQVMCFYCFKTSGMVTWHYSTALLIYILVRNTGKPENAYQMPADFKETACTHGSHQAHAVIQHNKTKEELHGSMSPKPRMKRKLALLFPGRSRVEAQANTKV